MYLNEQGQKKILKNFWSDTESSENKPARLEKLKTMAEVVIEEVEKPRERRRFYYKRKSDEPCFSCSSLAEHAHHIIQLQNGGIDDAINIAFVCRPCHKEVHPWMRYYSRY